MNKSFGLLSIVIITLLLTAPHLSAAENVVTGDERTALYMDSIKGKRVAVFTNQTGIAGKKHIVDLLISNNINVVAILSPEHGFRGKADAGEKVENTVDERTGIPVYSLYGKKAASVYSAADLFDVLVVDIQDVGLRFYTYYVTMWKLMNACAIHMQKVIVLDRPNPNGFYVDGPVLQEKYRSGVGWLPIPIVHGMTLGELALMINGEGWLENARKCALTIIPCKNYTHSMRVKLSVAPSPNLPNMKSIYLYPSTCLFEGTVMSLGRGTDAPFQIYGHPDMKGCSFTFIPKSRPGAKNPPLCGILCYGKDLRKLKDSEICKSKINLSYVIDAYNNLNIGDSFFTSYFEKLTGCSYIREMIENGCTAREIRKKWKKDVKKFKAQRRPYLIYKQ